MKQSLKIFFKVYLGLIIFIDCQTNDVAQSLSMSRNAHYSLVKVDWSAWKSSSIFENY